MNEYVETALIGWLALFLLAANLWLPYLLRRAPVGQYLKRMWPHYWIGYALPGLSLLHGWIPMSKGKMAGMNTTGLWLATAALVLMLFQVVVGLMLRNGIQGRWSALRTAHFWTMTMIAALILGHVVMNRP